MKISKKEEEEDNFLFLPRETRGFSLQTKNKIMFFDSFFKWGIFVRRVSEMDVKLSVRARELEMNKRWRKERKIVHIIISVYSIYFIKRKYFFFRVYNGFHCYFIFFKLLLFLPFRLLASLASHERKEFLSRFSLLFDFFSFIFLYSPTSVGWSGRQKNVITDKLDVCCSKFKR